MDLAQEGTGAGAAPAVRLTAAQLEDVRAQNRRLGLDLDDLREENRRLRHAAEQMRAEILVLSRALEPMHRLNEELAAWRSQMRALGDQVATWRRHALDVLALREEIAAWRPQMLTLSEEMTSWRAQMRVLGEEMVNWRTQGASRALDRAAEKQRLRDSEQQLRACVEQVAQYVYVQAIHASSSRRRTRLWRVLERRLRGRPGGDWPAP